jgi:cardiolipin synthase
MDNRTKQVTAFFRCNVPTILTFIRLGLIPAIVACMVGGIWNCGFWLFMIAATTDMADGFLARLLNQQTIFGAALDAVADKILIISVFSVLSFIPSPLFAIPGWFVGLVLLKEGLLVGGVVGVVIAKGLVKIQPTLLGKATMVAQTLFIIWLFCCYFFTWVPERTYYTMLGGLLVLVALSLLQYASIGFAYMRLSYESSKS